MANQSSNRLSNILLVFFIGLFVWNGIVADYSPVLFLGMILSIIVTTVLWIFISYGSEKARVSSSPTLGTTSRNVSASTQVSTSSLEQTTPDPLEEGYDIPLM